MEINRHGDFPSTRTKHCQSRQYCDRNGASTHFLRMTYGFPTGRLRVLYGYNP